MSKLSQHAQFIQTWMKSPSRMGAVVPSSNRLAMNMAQIAARYPGEIIELGAGTGSLTRALLESGICESELHVIEVDAGLARLLGDRFPKVNIIQADAADMTSTLEQHGLARTQIGAVVSSLPLLSLPKKKKDDILDQVFSLLPPDRPLIQFTYGFSSPVSNRTLERYGRKAMRIKTVFRNIPPATVWTYQA